MNTVNTLKRNMSLKFNRDSRFEVYGVHGDIQNALSINYAEKLKSESEETIEKLFSLYTGDINWKKIDAVKYILSSDKLFKRFKNAKSHDVYKTLINSCDINEKISANDLAKFNPETALRLFSTYSSGIIDLKEYSDFFLYISKELNLYERENDSTLKHLASIIFSSATNMIRKNELTKEDILEVVGFALESGILKHMPKYEMLETSKKLNLSDSHIEYINFLGENTDCSVTSLKLKEFSESDIEALLNLVKSIKEILNEDAKLIYDRETLIDFYDPSEFNDELIVKSILTVLHDFGFTQKEINTLNYKLTNGEKINLAYNELGGLEGYIYFGLLKLIYPNFIESAEEIDSVRKMSFMHYLLQNNKKKFLKTLRDNDLVQKLHPDNSVILKESVYSILNLNSLMLDDYKWLIGEEDALFKNKELYFQRVKKLDNVYKVMLNLGIKNISIEEFKFLLKAKITSIYVWIYLKALNAGDEIKKASQVPSLDNKEIRLSYMDMDKLFKSESDYNEELEKTLKEIEGIDELPVRVLSYISELVKEKSFKDRIFEAKKNIAKTNIKLTEHDWLKYFLVEDVNSFKSQIKNEADVLFFVRYYQHLMNISNSDFETAKKSIYLDSEVYKNFIKTINISDEFIKENEENIYDFFLKGLMDVFSTYHDSLRTASVKNNLSVITKAELAGKLNDIKYYPGDLEREIGYPIANEDETLWINNTALTIEDYKVVEKTDYETVIKLGVNPVNTCMSYNGGMYNECLLSNFDANKKVITVSKDNKIVARAILRLTKVSDTKIIDSSSSSLGFKDIEDIDGNSVNHKDEKLVLFLERCYTSSNDVSLMREYMAKLAFKKAKEMGIRLILSNDYNKSVKFNHKAKGYIYISQSKNGKQYLDSFGGETTNDRTQYVKLSDSGVNPVLIPNEDMFNKLYETKRD
jgi:hypothetical protein